MFKENKETQNFNIKYNPTMLQNANDLRPQHILDFNYCFKKETSRFGLL